MVEKEKVIKVIRGVDGVDKVVKEVLSMSEEHRKKVRRRAEDYFRKCPPEELALVVALFGIKTEVIDVATK